MLFFPIMYPALKTVEHNVISSITFEIFSIVIPSFCIITSLLLVAIYKLRGLTAYRILVVPVEISISYYLMSIENCYLIIYTN